MKSLTVLTVDFPESLKKDLSKLDQLDDKHIEIIIDYIATLEDSYAIEPSSNEVETLLNNTGLSFKEFRGIFFGISFIFDLADGNNERVEDYSADLKENEIISTKAAKNLDRLFKDLQNTGFAKPNIIDLLSTHLRVYRYSEINCILAPIFDTRYEPAMNPDEFDSKISTLLPAALVSLHSRGGNNNKSFNLLITQRDLEEFINGLKVALKKISILKKQYKL